MQGFQRKGFVSLLARFCRLQALSAVFLVTHYVGLLSVISEVMQFCPRPRSNFRVTGNKSSIVKHDDSNGWFLKPSSVQLMTNLPPL